LIEVRLEADLGPGVRLAGTPDVVAIDGDGHVAVLDLRPRPRRPPAVLWRFPTS